MVDDWDGVDFVIVGFLSACQTTSAVNPVAFSCAAGMS